MTDHLGVFEDLVRVETRLWNELDRAVKAEHDLSLAWLVALRVLDARPGSRVHDLAADVGISPGGASKLVDRLVGAGLVSRSSDELDRRASRLRLSAAGRRATRRGSEAAEEWLARRFPETLDRAQLAGLAALLGELQRSQGAEDTR